MNVVFLELPVSLLRIVLHCAKNIVLLSVVPSVRVVATFLCDG